VGNGYWSIAESIAILTWKKVLQSVLQCSIAIAIAIFSQYC